MAKRSFCAAIIMVLCLAGTAGAQEIVLQADYWMPFNGDGVTEMGYVLELAKAIFEPFGYTIVFQTVPWNRAISQARTGQCDGIVGAFVGDAEDFVFPAEEQGLAENMFYVRKGDPWRYTGIDSLRGKKFAVISDYSYGDDIDAYIATNPAGLTQARGEEPLEQLLAMLTAGRVDIVIEDRTVMAYAIKKAGLSGGVIIAGTLGEQEKLFIAFSPAKPNSAKYAKILSDGMAALRASGKLKLILDKYGLADWK